MGSTPSVALGSLLTARILFSVPNIVLGMVLPYAIKIHVQTSVFIGKSSGVLYGLSTAGSIFGTLVFAFFRTTYCTVRWCTHKYCGHAPPRIIISAVEERPLRSAVIGALSIILLIFTPIPEFVFHKYPFFTEGRIRSDVREWKKLADETGVFSRLQVYDGTESTIRQSR